MLFLSNHEKYVTKNVLRPRTGSGKTQDRWASGGMILKDSNDIRKLFEEDTSTGRPYAKLFFVIYFLFLIYFIFTILKKI
jgi:hypothetical protein